METLRLRSLQQPSRVERLLETYVSCGNLLPEGSFQIRDRSVLPEELQRVLTRAIRQGQAWSCWGHCVRTWLFTGDLSLPLSRERGTPVLQVSVYREDGQLQDSGNWMADTRGTWWRCAD
jgi:hypothetical protein